MDLVVFENNKPWVIDEFREGRFDYVELASDVAETKFFEFLFGQQIVEDHAVVRLESRCEKQAVAGECGDDQDLSGLRHHYLGPGRARDHDGGLGDGRVAGLAPFCGATHYLINNLCGRLFAAFFGPPVRGYAGPAFSASGQRAFE